MSEGKLHLQRPYDAWQPATQVGEWIQDDGDPLKVLVLLGPETRTADALPKARAIAATALELRHPSVLPLLEVVRIGERVAWIYEHFPAVGLNHTVGRDPSNLLSARAVADAVARVARAFVDLGPDAWEHPGPQPLDVLLDSHGEIRLAGFAGPFPAAPPMRAPVSQDGEPALVYRLGILLAHLVSGVSPGVVSDQGSHDALVRRALIRAMARPGPVLTERFGDWLRGMLAWDPAERPPLSTIPSGLRKVAEATGGMALDNWSDAHIDEVRRRVESEGAIRRGSIPPAPERLDKAIPETSARSGGRAHVPAIDSTLRPWDRPFDFSSAEVSQPPEAVPVPLGMPTHQNRLGDTLPDFGDTVQDDPTQESAGIPDSVLRQAARAERESGRHALSMPVLVGPPPEAMGKRPSLPREFLARDDESDMEAPVSGLGRWWSLAHLLWATGAMLTALAALLIVVNLMLWQLANFGGETAPEQPSISDVMGERARADRNCTEDGKGPCP